MPNTTAWVGSTLADLVLNAPGNRLADRGGQRIFDPPLVGVASAADLLFERFRHAVSPGHFMPARLLSAACGRPLEPDRVFVVSWALPYAKQIRRSNRRTRWPSSLYSHARNNAAGLIADLGRMMAQALSKEGFLAVAPALCEPYDAFRCTRFTFSSNWSERHVAYAAGLGRFGLNHGLITDLGMKVRFGSVVTDMPMEVTPRASGDHRYPCLGGEDTTCGRCIGRCPVGAISNKGLDKNRCNDRRMEIRKRFLDAYLEKFELRPALIAKSGTKSMGYSLGCALCQCGVPCENRDPKLGFDPKVGHA